MWSKSFSSASPPSSSTRRTLFSLFFTIRYCQTILVTLPHRHGTILNINRCYITQSKQRTRCFFRYVKFISDRNVWYCSRRSRHKRKNVRYLFLHATLSDSWVVDKQNNTTLPLSSLRSQESSNLTDCHQIWTLNYLELASKNNPANTLY